ncbi:uncharacterized protein LOC130670098 [Microplitis mediator]|uniref:uncharacterized protein LOC130670098 n=1 Tax=Microplitis mediator TaxID=375433 RepID=UPI00255273DC|nr:uncharacterized protein LOC130670098 [Microplitis mediator]
MVCRLMSNARDRMDLPDPQSYSDLINVMYSAAFGSLKRYTNMNSIQLNYVGNDALIIGDPDFIQSINFTVIHTSSTASVVPEFNNAQLLTYILAEVNGHVFPIVTILWSRRTPAVCAAVLNIIHHQYIRNAPLTIFTDFDLKLYFEHEFPNSVILGTYHSYCRIIFQKALNLELDTNAIEVQEFLKKCMGLILLPENHTSAALTSLTQSLPPNWLHQLQPFINYLQTEWIDGVTPNRLSLFQSLKGVNNISVLFTRELQYRLRNRNPTIWSFLRSYVQFINAAALDVIKIVRQPCATIKFPGISALCVQRLLLRKQWSAVNDNRISPLEFLNAVMPIQTEYFNNLLHNAEFLIEQQLLVNETNNVEPMVEAIEMICTICYDDPVTVVCLPCLHIQMCTECANNTQEQARINHRPLLCPFCNLPSELRQGNFRVDPQINIPLMTCELCNINSVKIVCFPCLHIKMCVPCSEERAAAAVNEDIDVHCPFCDEPAVFQRGFFPLA